MGQRTVYYESFSEDIIKNANQNYQLPEEYAWMPEEAHPSKTVRWIQRWWGRILYAGILALARCYCRFHLHAKVEGAEKFRETAGKGFFVYANHTQPVGDVCLPAWAYRRGKGKKRCYTIVSPANLGLPVIGRMLPYLGALPIPKERKRIQKLQEAIRFRLAQQCGIVIFPEAHVWPYYTQIRPFSDTSFFYPVEYRSPSYCMTVTYQKHKKSLIPRMTIYIDGPFYPQAEGHKKECRKQLCNQIYACMKQRSKASNYAYWSYLPFEKEA